MAFAKNYVAVEHCICGHADFHHVEDTSHPCTICMCGLFRNDLKHVNQTKPPSTVDHPNHYGGADNPYEAIKVIEAWGLGFNLGNVLKYISRNGKKPNVDAIEDLKKAANYIQFEIKKLEKKNGT